LILSAGDRDPDITIEEERRKRERKKPEGATEK